MDDKSDRTVSEDVNPPGMKDGYFAEEEEDYDNEDDDDIDDNSEEDEEDFSSD